MRKIICIILAVLSFLFLCSCDSNIDKEFEFGYLIDDTCYIKEVKNKEIENLTIPITYKGKKITEIGYNAFKDCENLEKVIIPEGITKIKHGAFQNCSSLKEVLIPSTLSEIEYDVFLNCNQIEYTVYENGKYLGNEENPYILLFAGINNDVTNFYINENCKLIYQKALCEFSKLTSISLPSDICYIGSDAFNFCSSLSHFIVPNNVEEFYFSCLNYCENLEYIKLGSKVKLISTEYIGCNKLVDILVHNSNIKFTANDGVLYSKDNKTLLYYPSARKSSSFSIPSYVESVSMHAFYRCDNLTSISFWSAIKTFSNSVVFGCKNLHTIHYSGTTSEWVKFDNDNKNWDANQVVTKIYCSNGTINRSFTR